MSLINIVGYTAAFLSTITFIPQVFQTWKTKKTKDISFLSIIFIISSTALWVIYGILTKQFPVLITNASIFILGLFLLILKITYK